MATYLATSCQVRPVSDRVKLARQIAARTKPCFIDTTARVGTKDPKALARKIAAAKPPLIAIPRERGGSKVAYTEEQLAAMRGGLTAEQYRRETIRKWGKRPDETRRASNEQPAERCSHRQLQSRPIEFL